MDRKIIFFILCGLSLFAGSLSFWLVIHNVHIGGDGSWYLFPMQNFFLGKGFISDGEINLSTPGYALISYFVYLFTGDLGLAAMIVSAIFYTLMIPAGYWATRQIFNDLSAILVAFYLAVCPIFLSHSYTTLTDIMFTCLILLSFGAYCKFLKEPGIRPGVVFGLIIGYAAFTREEGFIVWIAALLVAPLYWSLAKRENKNATVPWRSLLISICCSLAILSPWLIYLRYKLGYWAGPWRLQMLLEFVFRQVFFKQEIVPAPLVELDLPFLARIKSNAYKLSKYTVIYLFPVFASLGLLWLAWPVAAGRKIAAAKPRLVETLKAVLLFVPFLSPLAGLFVSYVYPRNLMPYLPFVVIILSGAMAALKEYFSPKAWRGCLAGIVFVSLFFATGAGGRTLRAVQEFVYYPPSLVSTVKERHIYVTFRQAGLWLKNNYSAPKYTIYSYDKSRIICYYVLGREAYPEDRVYNYEIDPVVGLDQVVEMMEHDDIFILNDYIVSEYRPELAGLFKDSRRAGEYGLKLLFESPEKTYQLFQKATK